MAASATAMMFLTMLNKRHGGDGLSNIFALFLSGSLAFGLLSSAQEDEDEDHREDENDGSEGDELFGFGGHGVGLFFDAGRGLFRRVAKGEGVFTKGEGGDASKRFEEFGDVGGVVFGYLFEFARDEDAGDVGENFFLHLSDGWFYFTEVKDKFAVSEKRGAGEGSVEVMFAGFDVEGAADKFGEVFGGIQGEMDCSANFGGRHFIEVELAAEVFERFEVCDGEVEIE